MNKKGIDVNLGDGIAINKEKIFSNYGLFSLLSIDSLRQFASLSQTVEIADPHTIIVNEGDFVDSFYLICSGKAEVTRVLRTMEKEELMHIVNLHEGDAIGLTETGLFSSTGIRKATVTSLTAMTLLKISLTDFHSFLSNNSQTYPALHNLGEQILLKHILKNSPFFQELPLQKLHQICNHMTRILIKKDEYLFHEGDKADKCYVLISGEIAILAQENKVLAVLKEHDIFGLAAFTDLKTRNASAKAVGDASIIAIDLEGFGDIIHNDERFQYKIALSRIEQLRPKRDSQVVLFKQEDDKIVVLSHLSNSKKLIISPQEYEYWLLLDGSIPLIELRKKYQHLNFDSLYAFIEKLSKAGFLCIDEEMPKLPKNSVFSNLITKLKGIWR